MYTTIKMFDKNKSKLTKQQYKTLRGQCLAGDVEGAIRGYYKILRRAERSKL